MASWPDERPDGYDADKGWDETNGEWSTSETYKAKGGGKYRTQIVVVAENKVFVSTVT